MFLQGKSGVDCLLTLLEHLQACNLSEASFGLLVNERGEGNLLARVVIDDLKGQCDSILGQLQDSEKRNGSIKASCGNP